MMRFSQVELVLIQYPVQRLATSPLNSMEWAMTITFQTLNPSTSTEVELATLAPILTQIHAVLAKTALDFWELTLKK